MPHLLILADEKMLNHDPGSGHPERADRLRAILSELRTDPIEGVRWATPQPALREQIERIHDREYVSQIDALRGHSAQLDPDTAVSTGSVDAAHLAAGAAIEAVTGVINGEARTALALVRPPGHHAERDQAMGFCLFNNIAIAAAHAVAELGCRRVLIVDWDVHHGNGTQHAFESRRDVLFFSCHQWPWYPGTGAVDEVGRDDGEGFTINAPIPAGMGDSVYGALFRRLLFPAAEEFDPDLVLVSAGFDAHRDDPLGGMLVTEAGFASLCGITREIADRRAQGRLVLILEGGYNLVALARSVRACVQVLAGATPPEFPDPGAAEMRVIDELCAFHRRSWRV